MTHIGSTWEVVAAAVSGRSHQRARRGSQDAFCVRTARGGRGFAVAVVCDGCSAGDASEVGAGLGARFVAADVARRVAGGASLDDEFAAAVIASLVEEIGRVARACAVDDVEAVIASCLLFTTQVAVVTDDEFVVFGVGDGVVRVDGHDVFVKENDDGAPDCAAYALVDGLNDHARVVVHARGRAASIVTIGSDGAKELERASSSTLPSGEVFGGLAVFERERCFVTNKSLATKRVRSLDGGAPDDDATFVVLRRAPAAIAVAGGASCA